MPEMMAQMDAREQAWQQVLELDSRDPAAARAARRRYVLRYGVPVELGGLAILVGLAALNALWFDAAGSDYLRWFVDNGALIALLFGVVAAAVDLDTHPGLIAASPLVYVRAILGVFVELSMSLSAVFSRERSDAELADAGLVEMQSRYRSRLFDTLLGNLFLLLLGAAMLAWALVVAPLQYWVNLVSGAPARMALASWRTSWRVEVTALHTEYVNAPKDPDAITDEQFQTARAEGRAHEITFASKPVSFSAAIAAAFLWALSQLA